MLPRHTQAGVEAGRQASAQEGRLALRSSRVRAGAPVLGWANSPRSRTADRASRPAACACRQASADAGVAQERRGKTRRRSSAAEAPPFPPCPPPASPEGTRGTSEHIVRHVHVSLRSAA
eukprot:15475531-Alexandrium_andersonii.AAC.1